ncbi:hypothetical protein M0805_007121 [Coniferiporia weirii]|nr:hypothetical protein M0805_007121 [Coniferiporia weirii]
MKYFSVSLLILVLSLCSRGARPGTDRCPSAQEVASSIITANGHEILHQTFTCPDGDLTKSPGLTSARRDFSRSVFEKRNAGECRTPAPECQCGANFSCECQDSMPTAPIPNDCAILIDSTKVIAQAGGSTFIVQPDSFELISFKTCEFVFINSITTPLEYCWDELGTIAGLVNQICFEAVAGTSAVCNADDGLWFIEWVHPLLAIWWLRDHVFIFLNSVLSSD